MLKRILLIVFFSASLSGCFLFSQEHQDYSDSEVCRGLKSELAYNDMNPNVSAAISRLNRSRIMEQMHENHCY